MMWQAMYERAITVSDRWRMLYRERSRHYDLQKHELERLKGVVKRLQEVAEKQQREINQLEFSKEYFENETKRLREEVVKSAIPYPKTASEVYAAQNELDLLRTIRQSQAAGITKLRQQLTEACAERDAASKRANAWRENYNRVHNERDQLVEEVSVQKGCRNKNADDRDQALTERDVARKGLSQAREEIRDLNERVKFLQEMREKAIHKFNDYCKELEQARRASRGLDQDRQKLYREMDILRNQLAVSQAVNHIVARREANNPRLEMMLEESYRNEFKRNIDNQKATDGVSPNCPSS